MREGKKKLASVGRVDPVSEDKPSEVLEAW